MITTIRNIGIDKNYIVVVWSLVLLALVAGCSDSHDNEKMFEDVTLTSGFGSYVGMTHGASWGDFDADGLPDLYITNHLKSAQLYRNLGEGRFVDVTDKYMTPGETGGDKHGALWADFNNDGNQDLVQLTGAGRGVGAEPKRLFRNDGNRFTEIGESSGVSNPYGRTRMPLWIDANHDGKLDLFHGAEVRFDKRSPPFVFIQGSDELFSVSQDAFDFALPSVPFCLVSELTNDAYPELICRLSGKGRTAQIFDLSSLPARELKLLPTTAFEDIAQGDFDNDGRIDLFFARTNSPGKVAVGRPGSNELIADVMVHNPTDSEPMGVSFATSGKVSFQIADMLPPRSLSKDDIHIGKEGMHPGELSFTLSPETFGVDGTPPSNKGEREGVMIEFVPPDNWRVAVIPPRAKGLRRQVAIKATASEPITEYTVIGAKARTEEAPFRLFMNRGGELVEEADKRGVNEQIVSSVNAVAGDFDNDMDLDLFVLASGLVGKHENLLLLNDGEGYFEVVPGAGGAAGYRSGVGDSVTVVDFDNDGFLDLFTATGGSMGRSLGLPSDEGGYQLYRNIGNRNHWLEIDLEGTVSNRDGIGSKVVVQSGGIEQVRIQDGGAHRRAQNHKRLHFGLGQNEKGIKIQVYWPSGAVQELENIGADQIVTIREPADKGGSRH
jgi:hypothetical protein